MNRIGLFYASETGNTERIAFAIARELSLPDEHVINVGNTRDVIQAMMNYDILIIGTPTWRKGYLAADWDDLYDDLCKQDFTGKTIALFGLGNQFDYNFTYLDGMGELAKIFKKNAAILIGEWPTEGYYFDESQADNGNGFFYGLGIDEDYQSDLTEERINHWVKKLKNDLTSSENDQQPLANEIHCPGDICQ